MMKRFFGKLQACAASAVLAATAFSAMPTVLPASAASTYWKFDFGSGGVANGYTGVSASTGYDASRGYGFSAGTAVKDVGASGSGALSDAVQFTNATSTGNYTFCADVPNGLYQVSVWLGNTNRTSVGIEKMYQIMNMTGNNAYHTLQVPVTDGQLNICACEGKAGYAFTLSALEIKQISTQTHTNPTIWVCGDSTVCNYYPLDSSSQAGWAQMLPQFIDGTKWQVMNMATSGQFAKGFLNAGQFTVIEKNGQPGDIYVISIGINDTNPNYTNESEYYTAVTDMAKRAMAKGMRVILVKQQGRNGDCQRNPLLTGRWFGGTLDRIGTELGIEVVDLFTMWQNYCLTKTADEVSAMYLTDGLHPNRSGATVLAKFMAEAINNGEAPAPGGATFDENTYVMFRNLCSGMYLAAEDGIAADGTNVSQTADKGVIPKNVWKLVPAGDAGEYYLCSMVGDKTYRLDVADGATADGTNMGIWSDTGSPAQVFKLLRDGDYYHIATAVSDYKSYVGIWGGSKEDKGNAIEWQNDGTDNQKWLLQYVQYDETDPLMQGDLDGDGVITAKDLTLLKRQASGEDKDRSRRQAGDLNGDLAANSGDAALLRDYLAGKAEAFGDISVIAAEQNFLDGVHETTNAGYKAEDYLNLGNNTVSAVTFTVNVPQAGNYLCTFNIANGSANDRKMMVTIDGDSRKWLQSFLTTGAWTTWEERALVLPLEAGINHITLQSETAEGGPNFDYLLLTFTDEPIAQPYDPNGGQTGPVVSDNPVLFVASDSTAQSYNSSYAPQQGWGYYLQKYATDGVTVSNHSIAGRSSKSFYDNGRLQTILDAMKPGDFLLVDFGINDGASSKPERYAPVCGKVDNPDVGSFEYYMEFYIEGAIAKGGTPILMSPTLSIKGAKQPFSAGYRNIDSACKMLASKYKIAYFDLSAAMANQFNSTDYNTVYRYYMGSVTEGGTDFTHFTETGADVVAQIIMKGLKDMNCTFSQFVK